MVRSLPEYTVRRRTRWPETSGTWAGRSVEGEGGALGRWAAAARGSRRGEAGASGGGGNRARAGRIWAPRAARRERELPGEVAGADGLGAAAGMTWRDATGRSEVEGGRVRRWKKRPGARWKRTRACTANVSEGITYI